VARAVRTPNRSESDGRFQAGVLEPGELYPGSPPVLIEGRGNEDLESEELTAYEVGYRTSLSETLTLDLSLFYNQYDDLVSSLILSPEPVMTPVPHLVLPVTGENGEEGETYGGELVVNWQARKWWKLIGAYSYIHWQIPEDELIWDTPSNQFTLRSLMDLSSEVELDTMFRYVDNFPRFGVPAYYALNVRLGWNPSENLEFSLVGEHLLNDTHREHGRELFTSSFRTEVEHSVYGKVTWRF
jgi:iron complex outermembrane receptor protein